MSPEGSSTASKVALTSSALLVVSAVCSSRKLRADSEVAEWLASYCIVVAEREPSLFGDVCGIPEDSPQGQR